MTQRAEPITLGYKDGIHHSCPSCLAYVPEDHDCPVCGEKSVHRDGPWCPLCDRRDCEC